ncbi:tudor hypothetical protein [Limosa lapponica baueri]|uniref:Tudor domain-containing protein n=1 Tax=Limosa lapponica baueri TaxID=1758121 RepID=A0A2I0T4M5_LIMLA|nr:tudor hypothetical protein [Limosa lapponica baueri]
MCHTYDQWEQDLLLKVGSPCAARGRDGQWYRALLLDLTAGEQDQQMALVIFVDYGRKETVTRANLRHLPVECFCTPVVTYACALQGISDGGCGWSPWQINELKALVLGKGVSAHIKAFSSFEHCYYVSLYGENGINLNHLFGVQACCLVSQTEAQEQLEVEESTAKELELPPGAPPVALTQGGLASAPVAGVHLKLGAFHDAQVSHLRDPSEFWLQLHEHRRLFRRLRQCMWNFYSHATKLDDAGWDLQTGSLCCASGKEGAFYRAVITRVLDSGVEIHLVDRGDTETVDRCAVKELLPRFRELPALALKCCLAGVSPLRGSWNEASVSAFREIVLNKGLKVRFLSAQGDKYMVEIFDQSQLGEKNVSNLMVQGGYAQYQRCETPETLQKSSGKAVSRASSPASDGEQNQLNAGKKLGEESDLKRSGRALNPCTTVMVREGPLAAIHNSKSSESLPALKYEGKENLPVSWRQNYVEMKPCSSYGGQLEVGSTVNVIVSYFENPSYFWCQLSRNCHDLKVLMAEIQEYCKNSSHPLTWPSSVCLAQYSEDEKWYRALIISEVTSAEKVEVVYVDYGNREFVSLANLRSTNERFLRLEAQAFRCSLYNLIQPNGHDPFAWDEEAIQAFQEFVDTSSSHFELKCTIFALASINNKELFNIVDLMTPFQSACKFLTERGVARPLSPQKSLVSSVQLRSYYYSMHGIKIGSEEDVYITHVEDPWTFYCQLERCADVLAQLTDSIGRLTETMTSLKSLQKSGRLCLAKYTDNHWLPEELSSIPAISIHCFLDGLKCKKNTDWAEKAVLYFTKRTSEVLLTCEFVEKVEDKWGVILSDHQGIITVDLADENLTSRKRSCSTEILARESNDVVTVCEPLPPQAQSGTSSGSDCKSFIWKFPEAGQTVKIYVTVVNGPEYFWSHSADTEDMNYIEEKLEEVENLELNSLNDFRPCIKSGDMCLAKYSQDGKFYRAEVCSVAGDNVVVRHVDYGSEEAVSLEMVRQIPCELLKVPNQAFACCLSGFNSSEGSWLSEAKEKFYNMTEDLLLEAEVVETRGDKASEVPLSVVKLEASGKSINEEMKPFWKANKGTGDNAFSNLENPVQENRCSNNDMGLCLKRETTAEHQSSFDKEIRLSEGESDNNVLLEPTRSCSLQILGSEMKAAEQELSEAPLGEDAELKAELTGSASAAGLFLNKQEELQRLPVLRVQSSSSDETGTLVELDQLQMHSSYDDLKELILELEALSVQSSFGEETKEALETESLEMQKAWGSEAREKVLEQESFELSVASEETGELATLKFLEILPSLNERENLVPSVSDGEKTVELMPSVVQLSLGEKAAKLELDLSGTHKAEATEDDWIEVESPPLRLSSSGGRSEKQPDLKTDDVLSMLGAEIEELLGLVLPNVQPSQEDGEEDLLGLEHAALQSSANRGSQFPFLTKDLTNRRPVCTVKSCDCEVEKRKEWQKKKDDCYVEEWMKQDLTDSFKECANTLVPSSDCKPGDEEVEKKQNENLADCGAEHSEYTCNLKGFAVGSKCVVWTSLKWCEARILEVSEKGTRVSMV